MNASFNSIRSYKGFTIIEVMIVIVLIGFMVSAIQLNLGGNSPEEELKKASVRFSGIFDIAAEYALLNNVELGVVVKEDYYQFVVFDGKRWEELPDIPALSQYELPPGIEIKLTLDDLPIEEPQIYSASTFALDDDEEFYQSSFDEEPSDPDDFKKSIEEKKPRKKIVPHIYILSGGDITPFRLSFFINTGEGETTNMRYEVLGLYTTPLKVEGPLFDE